MIQLLIGFLLSSLIAFLAYKKRSLSISGLFMAILLSTFLYYYGTYILWLTLMGFFISSSLLTRLKEKDKSNHTKDHEKGGRRDYVQVLANGLNPLIFAIIHYYTQQPIFMVMAVVAIASSNADTWASELGVLSKGKTISIINFKQIEKGLSGGISLFGTYACALGGFFISFIYSIQVLLFTHTAFSETIIPFVAIGLGGILGCFIDSYLGATVQAKYKCTVCDHITEKTYHHQVKAQLVRGSTIFTNDMVNLISSLIASGVVWFLSFSN